MSFVSGYLHPTMDPAVEARLREAFASALEIAQAQIAAAQLQHYRLSDDGLNDLCAALANASKLAHVVRDGDAPLWF